MRDKSKLFIGAAIVVAGLLIARFAFAIIHDLISTAIFIIAAVMIIGGLLYFGKNFRE